MVMSVGSVSLTTLFLGMLRPPKRITSTKLLNFSDIGDKDKWGYNISLPVFDFHYSYICTA